MKAWLMEWQALQKESLVNVCVRKAVVGADWVSS